MKKTYIFGAMALGASLLSFGNAESCFATPYTTINNIAVADAESSALRMAIAHAESAKELALAYPSEEYPGIANYIDRLLEQANADVVTDEDELVDALEEAAEATSLLLQVEPTVALTLPESEIFLAVQVQPDFDFSDEQAVSGRYVVVQSDMEVETPTGADFVAPAQDAGIAEPGFANPEDVTSELEAEKPTTEDSTDVTEIPSTGEMRKANIGEFVIAGIVGLMVILGAALVIGRKHHRRA